MINNRKILWLLSTKTTVLWRHKEKKHMICTNFIRIKKNPGLDGWNVTEHIGNISLSEPTLSVQRISPVKQVMRHSHDDTYGKPHPWTDKIWWMTRLFSSGLMWSNQNEKIGGVNGINRVQICIVCMIYTKHLNKQRLPSNVKVWKKKYTTKLQHSSSFIQIHNLLTNNSYRNVQIALSDTQTYYTGLAITVCVGYHDNT